MDIWNADYINLKLKLGPNNKILNFSPFKRENPENEKELEKNVPPPCKIL
jgi:hypothetical protein